WKVRAYIRHTKKQTFHRHTTRRSSPHRNPKPRHKTKNRATTTHHGHLAHHPKETTTRKHRAHRHRKTTNKPDLTSPPSPRQQQLSIDIWHTIQNKQRHAGIAPTGTEKSLAHMTCAALAARDNNERTIISTNSLALQTQFIDKDLPVVAEAIKNLTGYPLKYA